MMYVSNDLGYENVRKHRIIFIFFIVSFYSIDKKTKGNSQHTTGALRATSRTRRLRHVIALTDVIRKTRLFRRVITGGPPPARDCRRNGGFLSRFSKEIPSRWRHFPLLSHTPSRRYVKHEWISECIHIYVCVYACVCEQYCRSLCSLVPTRVSMIHRRRAALGRSPLAYWKY